MLIHIPLFTSSTEIPRTEGTSGGWNFSLSHFTAIPQPCIYACIYIYVCILQVYWLTPAFVRVIKWVAVASPNCTRNRIKEGEMGSCNLPNIYIYEGARVLMHMCWHIVVVQIVGCGVSLLLHLLSSVAFFHLLFFFFLNACSLAISKNPERDKYNIVEINGSQFNA